MSPGLRRLRGFFAIAMLGGVMGGMLMTLATTLASVLTGATPTAFAIGFAAALGTSIGLVSAGGFGLILALTSGGQSIDEISFLRASATAVPVAAFVPVALDLLLTGSVDIRYRLPAVALFGVFGALLGACLTGMAKAAGRRGLKNERR